MSPPEVYVKSSVGFEAILDQVGSFGPYQWRTWFIGGVFEIPMAFCVMFFVFGGANPGWYCGQEIAARNETNLANASYLQSDLNASVLQQANCDLNSTLCPHRVFYQDFTSVISEWDLVCDRQYISTIITTTLMAGIGLGAAVTGQLADMYGRRHVFIIVCVAAMLGLAAQALSTTWQMFAVIRFGIGFFVGGGLVLSYVIPLEVVGRQYRTLCTMVDGWSLGCLIMIVFAYFFREWRHLSVALGLFFMPLALSWFFLTESPRWLLQHKRKEEVLRVLNHIAKINKRPPPDLSDLELICKKEAETITCDRKYSFLDLFRSRELTINTFVMIYIWCLCSMAYYGIAINMRDVSGNLFVDFAILSVTDLVFKLSIIGTTKWFGRRRSLFAYLGFVSACFLTIIICDSTGTLDAHQRLRLTVALVGRGAVQATWGVVTVYSAELFPTVVRNIASSACSVGARVGGVLAPFVAYLHFIHRSVPYVVFTFMSLSCALLVCLLPETKDKPLPDALVEDDASCYSWACCRRKPIHRYTTESDMNPNTTSC